MDHLVSTYCNISIVVAGICTTAMNWRFSYQLGTTVWDSYTWATFSVAFDVSKWLICCRSTIDALLAHDRSPGRKGARDPLRVLGTGLQKLKVGFEDVFDSEKDIAKAGLPHQWRQRGAVLGDVGLEIAELKPCPMKRTPNRPPWLLCRRQLSVRRT